MKVTTIDVQRYAMANSSDVQFEILVVDILSDLGHRGRGYQMVFGTYRHTTHPSSIFQVCYPYHPFFGQTVKLVRRIRHQPSDSVIIELPDGLEIAIPSWMLDPLACHQVQDAGTPSVSTAALLALDELLQSSGLLLPAPSSTSGPSQATLLLLVHPKRKE